MSKLNIFSLQKMLTLVGGFFTIALALTLGVSHGAFTGSVNNNTNTARTGIFGATGTCTNAANTLNAFFVHPLDDANAATVVSDDSPNNRPGTYLVPAGTLYRQPGPCPRDAGVAITLNGTTAYTTSNATAITRPENFSIQIWFRTAPNYARGGRIMGFGDARTGTSGNYDRHLYMLNNGQISFGVYPNTEKVITSPLAYNDGKWHHAVASISSTAGATVGQRLYIDGQQVAVDTTTTVAQNYATGWWRVGYDNLNGWPNRPTSDYWAGSAAYSVYFTRVLTAAQVNTLYLAGLG